MRFYEAWDNGDPLTTRFKFEEGTIAHARIPAHFMCRVVEPPVMRKRSRFFLNDRDLKEYIIEFDFLNTRQKGSGARRVEKSRQSKGENC